MAKTDVNEEDQDNGCLGTAPHRLTSTRTFPMDRGMMVAVLFVRVVVVEVVGGGGGNDGMLCFSCVC